MRAYQLWVKNLYNIAEQFEYDDEHESFANKKKNATSRSTVQYDNIADFFRC